MAEATPKNYYYALGRRKSATARVRVQKGKGSLVVNSKPATDYFAGSKALMTELNKPFAVLEIPAAGYDVSVVVSGGGHAAQADAISLGIAKALVEFNADYKSTLKRADLLSRDPRERERKKFGLRGARKQRQFTKR
ncbi:MAG TPA: 30S ribosomal protein S9 [Candidatus Saccharimonadales bacterium]|nr:30S ribosomal protein S9 [Candidatus Saccharimonadales bacterium]